MLHPAGFGDASATRPRIQAAKQPLEAGRGKEVDSPLEPPQWSAALPTYFRPQSCKMIGVKSQVRGNLLSSHGKPAQVVRMEVLGKSCYHMYMGSGKCPTMK